MAVQVLAVQLVVTVVLAAAGMTAVWLSASQAAQRQVVVAANRAVDEVANDPEVIAALLGDDPVEALRAPVNRIRTANAMTFITVMDVHGVRLAHPNDAQIGEPFIGDISGALRGETVSEEIVGTYGPLMQVNRGIRGPDGAIIAVVSAGQEESLVRQSALETSGTLLAIIGGAGIVAVGVALWFGRRVNQQTHGLSAGEITRLWTYHRALLASVTQGMILIAEDGEIRLINAAARRLLGLAEDASVASVADLGLGEALAALLTSGAEASGEVHVVGPRLLMVNQTPAELPHGGWVATFQDTTELASLSESLGAERAFADVLRARVHDADNQLHTVVSLIELGEPERAAELVEAAMGRTQASVDLITSSVRSPALAALLVSKSRLGHDQGVEVRLTDDGVIPAVQLRDEDLITLAGSLIDNAIEAALRGEEPRWVNVRLGSGPGGLAIAIATRAPASRRSSSTRSSPRAGRPRPTTPTAWAATASGSRWPRPRRTASAPPSSCGRASPGRSTSSG